LIKEGVVVIPDGGDVPLVIFNPLVRFDFECAYDARDGESIASSKFIFETLLMLARLRSSQTTLLMLSSAQAQTMSDESL
jgi:hypothetical protein